MALPTGEIIARPMMARSCGCLREFQHYAVDRFRAQRLAKFQSTRCAECVAKDEEAHRQALAALPTKGETFQLLPDGATFSITRIADGKWSGTLTAGGTTVKGIADVPHGLPLTLARQWFLGRAKKPEPGAKS
jgi:hypothetical protein